jgi:hypothetical protein
MEMISITEADRSLIKSANPRLIAPELTIQKMLKQVEQELDRLANYHRATHPRI